MPPAQSNVLVAESRGFSSRAAALLADVANLSLADLDRAGLLNAARDADILWVRLRHRIDGDMLDHAPRLKMIVSPTTGLNHIDMEEAQRRGIRVLSLRGENDFLKEVRATAEHTVALILTLLRNIPRAVAHVTEGHWNRDLFKGQELCGKALGVVGYGRLGQLVGKYLQAFDSEVIVTDPAADSATLPAGVSMLSLQELLRRADIVTLHVNLTPETQAFFGADELSAMKPNAWLINTSRGELIDEAALLAALQSGRLAGAALDVLAGEDSAGMSAHPLVTYARAHDNLIITPHIGGCTIESMEKTEVLLAGRLRAFLTKESVQEFTTRDC